jgi:hypothetical protein
MNGPTEVARESVARVARSPADSNAEPETPPTVELHIEELVLGGFAAGDRFRIGDAVQAELARLITEGGVSGLARRSASIDRLDAGAFQVAAGAPADRVGPQVARKVYEQLSTTSRHPSPQEGSRTEGIHE